MENKKTFKVILFNLALFMLLSWIIKAGYFTDEGYVSSGFNQFGLFDFLLAPLQVFNYFAVTMIKNIDGYVNQVGYGNIIIAFISIGIFYGVLNKTGVYSKLINDIKNKIGNRRNIFLFVIAFIFCIISSLTGLGLLLFLFFPFVSAILLKLKYSKITTFMSTIGAMLIGQIGSLYNPNINGINRILFQSGLHDNILGRIILLIILMIVLFATLYFDNNKDVKKQEEILLLNDVKGVKSSYWPLVIIFSAITIILLICMYNWYYMFNIANITSTYNKMVESTFFNYNIMKNFFGMSEAFGYWTGFTMSSLLLLASIVISFVYNIKVSNLLEGAKKGFVEMLPTIFYSILALTLISFSLNNGNSFIYSIINNVCNMFKNNQVLGLFTSTLLHNYFVNDYFALLSSLSTPITSIYGYEQINFSLFVTQVGHGIVSLITPFNVYLIAGLSFLKIPYTKWIKYIWKYLLIIIAISLVILFIVK